MLIYGPIIGYDTHTGLLTKCETIQKWKNIENWLKFLQNVVIYIAFGGQGRTGCCIEHTHYSLIIFHDQLLTVTLAAQTSVSTLCVLSEVFADIVSWILFS